MYIIVHRPSMAVAEHIFVVDTVSSMPCSISWLTKTIRAAFVSIIGERGCEVALAAMM